MKRLKLKIFKSKVKSEKKVLKGMTLLEIIISMVILVIISTLVAEAGSGVVTNVRTSKSVIEKVNYQSRYISASEKKYTDVDGNEKDLNKSTVSFRLSDATSGSALGNPISADVYEAPGMEDAIDYKDGTYKRADGSVYDRAGNLKYFE